MIDDAPVMARLIDQVDEIRETNIEGALEWAGLRQAPSSLRYFVVPSRERAGRNERSAPGTLMQRVESGFSVIVVMPAAGRDQDGIRRSLRERVKAVRDTLNGWLHPEASSDTLYQGGQLLAASNSTIAWSIDFTAPYRISKK